MVDKHSDSIVHLRLVMVSIKSRFMRESDYSPLGKKMNQRYLASKKPKPVKRLTLIPPLLLSALNILNNI